MAKLIVFILVTISLTLVHCETSGDESVPASGNGSNNKRDLKDEDHFDLSQPDGDSIKYGMILEDGGEGNAFDGAPSRSRAGNSRNLARLLSAMPQFSGFYAGYSPEKRSAELRRFVVDKDDKEFTGLSSGRSNYRELSAIRNTERLLQLLRDHMQANPGTYSRVVAEEKNYHPELYVDHGTIVAQRPMLDTREKRRRCQFDPALGIKNPSSCDTDSYFGAADYTMRNVWDSAGRR